MFSGLRLLFIYFLFKSDVAGGWRFFYSLHKNLNLGEYLHLLITFSRGWLKVLGKGCVCSLRVVIPSTEYDRNLSVVSLA